MPTFQKQNQGVKQGLGVLVYLQCLLTLNSVPRQIINIPLDYVQTIVCKSAMTAGSFEIMYDKNLTLIAITTKTTKRKEDIPRVIDHKNEGI